MRRDRQRIYDEYLVAVARNGDRPSLEALSRRFQKRMLAHAWRLTGDADMAADAVQSAWVDIVRGLPRLNDTAAFPAWAFRIVTRRCARAIAAAKRHRDIRAALAREPQPETDADSSLERRRDGQSLTAAMARLSGEQQAVMALFYLEDLSVTEISMALDIPAGTVKTRLMHARRRLRTILQGDEDNG